MLKDMIEKYIEELEYAYRTDFSQRKYDWEIVRDLKEMLYYSKLYGKGDNYVHD